MTANLTGSLVELPEDSDATFDPRAVVVGLTRSIRAPLRLAPPSATDRLVDLLRSQERLFDVFERASRGDSLRLQSDELGIPYVALVALFESDDPSIVALRKVVRAALASDDRARARAALITASDPAALGILTEGEKRLIDANLSMAKHEEPTSAQPTKVSVGISFGDALVAHHKQARAAGIVIEHESGHDLSELGL